MVEIKKISLCSECAKSLKDPYHLNLWESVCRRVGLYKKFYLITFDGDIDENPIRQLELKGFITSTEISENTISIRPTEEHTIEINGHKEIFYCAKPDQHLEDCND